MNPESVAATTPSVSTEELSSKEKAINSPQEGLDLLTLEQAMQFLGVSKPTIYRLVTQNRLKGLKAGRQWRFRRADLTAFLENRPEVMASAGSEDLDAQYQAAVAVLEKSGEAAAENLDASEEQKLGAIINWLLISSLEAGASDIHMEAVTGGGLVRLRVDGVLSEWRRFSPALHISLLQRLKSMAAMDFAETSLPQDGVIKLTHNGNSFALRCGTCPVLHGESMVIRILAHAALSFKISELNFAPEDEARLRRWYQRPSGLILVAGPGGSGKTTTLYSGFLECTGPGIKAVTVENPIEYAFENITQIPVVPKAGLFFAEMLRAVMRQDPDIILCGETRDRATAELLCEAALTGHLAWTTIHADDAAHALRRLMDFGVEPYFVRSAVLGVLSQRLARRICPHCREEVALEPDLLAKVVTLAAAGGYTLPAEAIFYQGRGCEMCRHLGYRRRVALYELLEMNPVVGAAILQNQDEDAIARAARASGTLTMMADGIRKAIEGITTVGEVIRVLGHD